MHEFSLLADLLRKIENIRVENDATKITAVTVKLGALAHISADHFREHFVDAVKGTPSDGAHLNVIQLTDETDPHAQEILLDSVEVAD